MELEICWFVNSIPNAVEREGPELARGLRRRDPALLERLIEKYRFRLFRYLLYVTADRATAEELFQETWLRVLERGHRYDGRHRFETWLFTVTRRLVIDHQRRRQARSWELLDPAGDEGALGLEADRNPSALDRVLEREESDRLGRALSLLPAAHREVLVLRFHEDMSLEEIAAVVAAPLSTVKSRLYRGLEALRDFIERPQP